MSGDLRIVSLAPTQTEILAALGLADQIVGITENCDHPLDIVGKTSFGSWYGPDLRGVIRARPDLVCTFGAHQEEVRDALGDAGLDVYHSDPGSVAEALNTIDEIASLTDRTNEAQRLMAGLKDRLEAVRAVVDTGPQLERPRVLRIMNWAPLITVGPGSFQDDVIRLAGGNNVASDGPARYFVCTRDDMTGWDPEAVFFCEPEIQKLLAEDPLWRQTSAFRHGRLHVFDCGLTCRSGPRIVDMVESLARAMLSRKSRTR